MADSQQAPRQVFPVRSREELMAMAAPTFLIDQVIPERALIAIYGPPGAGKTFIALDMALSVCTNQDWFGYETKPGPVIYITPEGLSGLKQRLLAWEHHHQAVADRFGYVTDAPQFLEDDQVDDLIASIKKSHLSRPVLIVIDTLARHMVGGDENSALYMGEFIANVDRLRREFGCAVIVVHHTGKGNGGNFKERGSTALRGAADTMILVENESITLSLTCEKQKESEPFAPIPAALLPVTLASGESSCVSVRNEIEIIPSDKLDQQKEKILKVLLEADATGLRTKEIYRAAGVPESSYHRHRDVLISRGLIEKCDGQRYRLTESGREKALTLSPLPQHSHESAQTLPSLHTPFRGGSGESGGEEAPRKEET